MDFEAQAQRWHETDHGTARGKKLKRSKFIEPVPDEPSDYRVPAGFEKCRLCNPSAGITERNNPFWFRVRAHRD